MLFVLEDELHHQLSAAAQKTWRKIDRKAKIVIANGVLEEFLEYLRTQIQPKK